MQNTHILQGVAVAIWFGCENHAFNPSRTMFLEK